MCARIWSDVLGRGALGLQRLQGRYPAACAAAVVSKKRTFERSGRRLLQLGLQNTPVVATA